MIEEVARLTGRLALCIAILAIVLVAAGVIW